MVKNTNKNNKNLFFLQSIKKSEVKELINDLSKDYEDNLDFLNEFNFYSNSKGKTFISKINLANINIERINAIGIYFGTFHDEKRFRLSIEGSRLINPKNNFIKITKEQLKNYLAAENLFIDEIETIKESGTCPFLIVKHENEKLGCVSIKKQNNLLLNYVPKSRKLDFNKVF